MKTSFRVSRDTAILIVCLAGVYWHYSRLPLHHTDLWGHLAFGRWMVEHGRIPATEPFMPLARGVPMVDTAWLSQLAAFGMHSIAGLAGLQTLHALAATATCGLLCWSVAHRTGSALSSGLAVAIFVCLEWFQFRIIRPQMAGLVGFVALDALLTTRQWRRRATWGVPLLFVAWANLHGSFVTGLGLMVMSAGGRALDVALRRRSLRAVLLDRRFRWLMRLTLCASLVALLNPYGPQLYVEVLTFAKNPNLRDLLEWMPLQFNTRQGRGFIVVAMLLIVTGLAARRRIAAETWLPVLVFGAATVWSARMIVWWSPLAAALIAVEASLVCRKWRDSRRTCDQDQRRPIEPASENRIALPPVANGFQHIAPGSGIWTGIALTSAAIALAAGPLDRMLWDGADADPVRALSPDTPVAATAWLRDHSPTGVVFNTYEWGDYVTWAGPPNFGPFVTSQVHLIPVAVWRDYREISRALPDCLERLETRDVTTVLLDRQRHRRLDQRLAGDPRWSRDFVDRQAVIYSRRASRDGG